MTRASLNIGYRRVLLSRAPLKTKLAALARMPEPSSNLLTALIRDVATHPKLKLLAADRLAELVREREIENILRAEAKNKK